MKLKRTLIITLVAVLLIPCVLMTSCGTNGSGSSDTTTAKPADNTTTAKPDDVTTAKPGDVTTANPGDVTTAKPGDVTTAKPGDVTTANPDDVTTAKPADTTEYDPMSGVNPADAYPLGEGEKTMTEKAVDFADVDFGTATAVEGYGTVTVNENGLFIERDGDWVTDIDYMFTTGQNWSDANGIMVEVDFTAVNNNATHASTFTGIDVSIYTDTTGATTPLTLKADATSWYSNGTVWKPVSMKTYDKYPGKSFVEIGYKRDNFRFKGVVYIPFSAFEGLTDTSYITGIKLECGSITSGSMQFVSVYKVTSDITEYLNAKEKYTVFFEILKNIKMNAIGDSYFAGNGLQAAFVWPAQLATKYNMSFKNYGINGSPVAKCDGGHDHMIDRYMNMEDNNADLILIEGGKNDFNNSVPIGTNADTAVTTFKGALKKIITDLKAKYPNAMIVCVTVWNAPGTNSLGNTVVDYGVAMEEIADLMQLPVFRAYDPEVSHVDMTSLTFRTAYCLTSSDVSHLNEQGHQMVLPYFEAFIAEQYALFKAN